MNGEQRTSAASPANASRTKLLWVIWLTIFAFIVVWVLVRQSPKGPLAQMKLADGRILQIEAVTYGTTHRIGHRSIIHDHLGPWMPQKMRDWFAPKSPENTINLERPGLVVWVNAIDPATGTNVDCQGIRVEFVDRHGDLFGQDTSSWFGGQNFWRVGHVFYCYPREEEQLKLRVTPWKKNKNTPVTAHFKNPQLTKAAVWNGDLPPQTKSVGPLGITLRGLNVRTNQEQYWQTPSKYLAPDWELSQNGQPAPGWSEPEWIAEDPTGNRGQHLGLHQAALRFSVTIYPTATNADGAVAIARLPPVNLGVLTNKILWNSKQLAGTNDIFALGICPPGSYVFSDGNFDPSGPSMGTVSGGAPSGWTSQSKRLTPIKLKTWHGHYTPSPTIYVRADHLQELERLAIRLRDEQGGFWIAEPEPQGVSEGIHPFLIKLPPDVTNVVPELVLLKPVQAEFLVKIPALP